MFSFVISFILMIFILTIIGAILAIPLFVIYVLFRNILALFKINSKDDYSANKTALDNRVDSYLKCIQKYGRVTFKNIIIDSKSGNTDHTEIDELIITPYGIFCVEYKANRGIIFGSFDRGTWTQCRYDGKKPIHNPLHQNYKHVRALHDLLGDKLKYPIQSCVVYTDATDIHVDSARVFLGVNAMESEIAKLNIKLYSIDDCRSILETLVPAVEAGRSLRQVHINEVQEYLASLRV